MKRVEKNIWLTAGLGGLCSVLLLGILSSLAALLIERGTIPLSGIEIASFILIGLSAIAGAMFTVLKAKRCVLPLCLISATVLFLTLAIMNGVLQKGAFFRIGETILTIYSCAVLTGLLCAKKKQRF